MATFELTKEERAEADKWWPQHLDAHHKGKNPYAGAIGGAAIYSIAFTTIGGPIVHMVCSLCQAGRKLEFRDYAGCLTDFSDW